MLSAVTRIAVIGELDPQKETHRATTAALRQPPFACDVMWVASDAIADAEVSLAPYDGIWLAPGGPYRDIDGALRAVRFARERGVPFVGTCGGFQYAVLEYARNVLRLADAAHAEIDPDAPQAVITPLTCSLAGRTEEVEILAGTLAHRLYGASVAGERFFCTYGIDDSYEPLLREHGMRISGVDREGHARIIELPCHPFFLITLFVPQMRSLPDAPHPLVLGFVNAAVAFATATAC